MKLRIATRKSALALAQTRMVAAALRALQPGLEVEEVQMLTQGDRLQDVPLSRIGGKGVFVSELETALLEQRADLAVHSLKDVPARMADGLVLGAVPLREDPRDVLVTLEGQELDDLSAGDRIGTSSLRRANQLRRLRPDLDYAPLRGNVDTRIRKLERGEYHAIVLAYAGLKRLGLADRPLWPIPVEQSIPAVGQGALALQARAGDAALLALLRRYEHPDSRLTVEAERGLLARLGGDCNVPLAGHAQVTDAGVTDAARSLSLCGLVAAVDGGHFVCTSHTVWLGGDEAQDRQQARQLGEQVAEALLADGAGELIRQAMQLGLQQRDPRIRPS